MDCQNTSLSTCKCSESCEHCRKRASSKAKTPFTNTRGSKQKRKWIERSDDSSEGDGEDQPLNQARIALMRERMSAKADTTYSANVQPQTPGLMLNNADVVKRLSGGGMFSNAHDFMIAGGHFYSGQVFMQQALSRESDQGLVPGMRVIDFEDISINREIYKTRRYRLHSDNSSGRARVVKVYQGPRAKEHAQEAARIHKKVMHPTFLHIVGVSPLDCEVPFLVFNGGFEGSLEVCIAKALEKDLTKSITLGLQTVIGLSSGLDYLRDVGFPFITAGSQHFCAFLNLEGEVVISFDPNIHDESEVNVHNEQSSLYEVDQALLVFHKLCEKTFDAACQAHYEWRQVERTYDDMLEIEDRFENLHDTASISAISPMNMPKPLGMLPIDAGHRRELVWRSDNKNSSLEVICLDFKAFLDTLPVSSEPALHHRRGRYTVGTAHRCPGYNRTEITLTPNITRSAIVSHFTPLPHEICPLCNQVVKEVEIFNCICGGEDDESLPTIQCSKCCEWHHRHCVDGLESMERCLICPNCRQGNIIGLPGYVRIQPNAGRISPPQWLSSAMQAMRSKYPTDRFEITLRRYRASISEWRIKCQDCPGKLYTPGPGETLSNYEAYLKNIQHRQCVHERLGNNLMPLSYW